MFQFQISRSKTMLRKWRPCSDWCLYKFSNEGPGTWRTFRKTCECVCSRWRRHVVLLSLSRDWYVLCVQERNGDIDNAQSFPNIVQHWFNEAFPYVHRAFFQYMMIFWTERRLSVTKIFSADFLKSYIWDFLPDTA